MSKKILAILLLILVLAVAGCGGSDEGSKDENGSGTLTYGDDLFNFSLYDTSGNLVSVMPDEKTMFVYFTGVN